jgi:hypothetical protein
VEWDHPHSGRSSPLVNPLWKSPPRYAQWCCTNLLAASKSIKLTITLFWKELHFPKQKSIQWEEWYGFYLFIFFNLLNIWPSRGWLGSDGAPASSLLLSWKGRSIWISCFTGYSLTLLQNMTALCSPRVMRIVQFENELKYSCVKHENLQVSLQRCVNLWHQTLATWECQLTKSHRFFRLTPCHPKSKCHRHDSNKVKKSNYMTSIDAEKHGKSQDKFIIKIPEI